MVLGIVRLASQGMGPLFLLLVGMLSMAPQAAAQDAATSKAHLDMRADPGTEGPHVASKLIECPAMIFVGSVIQFTGTASNTGQIAIDNVTVVAATTAQLVMSNFMTSLGAWTPGGQNATLNVGTLNPGVSVTYSFNLTGVQEGTATFSITVFGETEQCQIEVVEPTGTIHGKKWLDENGNGVQDGGEAGLPDWTIFLDTNGDGQLDGNEPSTMTGTDGAYTFEELPLGTYRVREAQQQGWEQTFPSSGGGYELTFNGPGTFNDIDFGNRPIQGAIHGVKFHDQDGDGAKDNGEPGLPDWTIFLDANNNGQLDDGEASALTDVEGKYWFEELPPGTYRVREAQQQGWEQTFPSSGGGYEIGFTASAVFENVDFGNRLLPGSIHGHKYFDLDNDGEVDPDEPGLDGFEILLKDDQGTVLDRQKTHSVDLNNDGVVDPFLEQGLFWFFDVPPGSYIVEEVVPDGWMQTDPDPPGIHAVTVREGDTDEVFLFFGNYTDDEVDYGDLPGPAFGACPVLAPVCYPTLQVDLGPFHFITDLWLGDEVDPDDDGRPTAAADGDDFLDGLDDEDGISSVTILANGSIEVELTATVPAGSMAFVDAWIDLNDDGFLDDLGLFGPSENIFSAEPVVDGPNTLTTDPGFLVPGEDIGYARFRISSAGGLPPTGGAVDGEVEDYLFLDLDFGDAPDAMAPDDPGIPDGYPTKRVDNGARHIIIPFVRLGDELDGETDGLPSDVADGDDTDGDDDEDGIGFIEGFVVVATRAEPGGVMTFRLAITQGAIATIEPLASVPGKLDAWVDWNRDGDWGDAGEQVIDSEDISAGTTR